MDASGDPSEMASRTTLARFVQAGRSSDDGECVICEIHRTWNRPEAAELAQLYTMSPELPGGHGEAIKRRNRQQKTPA